MHFRTDARGQYRIEWLNPRRKPGEQGHDWTALPAAYYARGDREATLRQCAGNWPHCQWRVYSRLTPVISV